MGVGDKQGTPESSYQLCCEPKNTLKNHTLLYRMSVLAAYRVQKTQCKLLEHLGDSASMSVQRPGASHPVGWSEPEDLPTCMGCGWIRERGRETGGRED